MDVEKPTVVVDQPVDENRKRSFRWPEVLRDATIISALVGLFGSGVAALLGAQATRELERQKFEAERELEGDKFRSSLILKALDASDSESALKNLKFLVNVGLIQDPKNKIVDSRPEDVPVIAASPRLFTGSSGPGVLTLQVALQQLGYLKMDPDGVFGPATSDAVRKFQEDQHLRPDGVVGPEVVGALGSAVARKGGKGAEAAAELKRVYGD